MLTDAQLSDLLSRSAKGEGVMAVLKEMGINPFDGTEWLRKHHMEKVIAAKKEQIKAKKGAGK